MSKKRILYVEDDETLAFLTADNLEQHFDVLHCNNGKEAFQLFCRESFDLCVLDIMLPDMDGFDLREVDELGNPQPFQTLLGPNGEVVENVYTTIVTDRKV